MSDEIAQRYEALQQAEGGWSVYRVRRGGWRDKLREDLSETHARALVAELERTKR